MSGSCSYHKISPYSGSPRFRMQPLSYQVNVFCLFVLTVRTFFFSPPAYVYLYSWVLRLDSHHLTLMFEFCSVPEDEFGCRVFAINRPFLDCYTYTTITRIMNECVKENAVCILAVQMRDLLYY